MADRDESYSGKLRGDTTSGIFSWDTGTQTVYHSTEVPQEVPAPIKLGRKACIDDLLNSIK